ncbi:MAG TPA: SxtJ family membrane protein [Verrucomicrobiae bacterium]|nr:SxtJ family membrane protein [Verrucomicrobiae bacterium]
MLAGLPLNPTNRTLRQFAAAWFVVFLIAAVRNFVRGHSGVGITLILIGLVGLAGIIKPLVVKHLFISATVVAYPLGWILKEVMLAIMFFVVLTPIALICRRAARDSLQRRRQTAKSSLWTPRGDPPPPENYLKQF